MGRPHSPMDCIGTDRASNERMRAAWALELRHGAPVFILTDDGAKWSQWQFSHYTTAGARLFMRIEGRHYSRLINWDRGDQIFDTVQALNVQRLMRAIERKSRADIAARQCEADVVQIIEEIKAADGNACG